MQPQICFRKVNNFGSVKKHHLIDSGSFNKELFDLEVPIASPKLIALMDKIKELDKIDARENKQQFKHMIFTDIKSPKYGFKIIASAFVAAGYEPCFEVTKQTFHLKDDENLRRTEGMNFGVMASKPMYNLSFSTAFRKKQMDKFNKRDANINGDLIRFIILDFGFTEGIDVLDTKYVHLFEPLLPSSLTQAVGRSTRFCGQRGLKFIPTAGWPLHVYKYDVDISKLKMGNDKTGEDVWLSALNLDPTKIAFANVLKDATIDAAVDKELTEAIHSFSIEKINKQRGGGCGCTRSAATIGGGSVLKNNNSRKKESRQSRQSQIMGSPPTTKLGVIDMHKYVSDHFGQFRYPKAKLENKCNEISSTSRIITFTPTQDFVRYFFTNESPYKGIMLYLSVGVGKLCAGIATATTSFDKAGYTILWVTRHTLKADFWKNMIGQICNVVTIDKYKDEGNLPPLTTPKTEMVSSNWIEPISYRQFTNLLLQENKYYEMLVERNGAEDPLRRTLLIVDECHKLYSETASPTERPNMNVFEKWIQHSYKVSGKDSVRLILMSGTPYTDDAMELVKLFNLMREEDDQFPATYSKFSETYLNNQGTFTKSGLKRYQDEISGYVSYVDRSQDARNFSYPVIHNVLVPISIYQKEEKTKEYDVKLKALKEDMKATKVETREKVAMVKSEGKAKMAEAKQVQKDAVLQYKQDVKQLKEEKTMQLTKCMEYEETAKSKKKCKDEAKIAYDSAIRELMIGDARTDKSKQKQDLQKLKESYQAQVDGIKTWNMLKPLDKRLRWDVETLQETMAEWKMELKAIREKMNIAKPEMKLAKSTFKEMLADYKNTLKASDDKNERRKIRASMRPDVKIAEGQMEDIISEVYNLNQEKYLLQLKMKRDTVRDYSQSSMYKNC